MSLPTCLSKSVSARTTVRVTTNYVLNSRAILLVFLGGFLISLVPAWSAVPQSYTLRESSSLALEAMFANSPAEIDVSRFGPREFVDVTIGTRTGRPAVHARHWFDLVAHKAYTLDVIHDTCSWMKYTAADMPSMYDPLATPAPSAADLAKLKQSIVRKESVNGIAANLTETSSDQGKSRIWIAENGNYPLKAEMAFPGAEPAVVLEVKALHFEKPPAGLLAPPANCTTQAQGEWTADGMSAHTETTINAEGAGQAELKTGKAKGEATVKSGVKPR